MMSVWLYFRFALSFRDVEEMLAMRGVSLTYETVENGALSSVGLTPTDCAADLHDLGTDGTSTRYSLRSMVVSITSGVRLIRMATCWIFLSSDQRDKKAAKKFFRKMLKGLRYVPSGSSPTS